MPRRNDRTGGRSPAGPELIVVSFPSAIPRRVAPQQSPLPLRRRPSYSLPLLASTTEAITWPINHLS
jgi:hypothetical protein